MSRAALTWLLLPCLLGITLADGPAHAKDNLPTARRKLLEAHGDHQVRMALDALQKHIRADDWFPNASAFAKWLAEIPDGRDKHPVVLERRGWAHMVAKEGALGVPVLQAALKSNPSSPLIRSFLAECLRLEGRFVEAADMIAKAAACGFEGPYLHDGMMQTLLALHNDTAGTKAASGLPPYVIASQAYLAQREDPILIDALATWLATDLDRFERVSTPRGLAWAEESARLALAAATRQAPAEADRLAQRTHEAAKRLMARRDAPRAASLIYTLLATTYRLGAPRSEREQHRFPEAMIDFAEAALHEERWRLAHRLLTERVALGRTPRIDRLAALLPPDLDPP